MVLVQNDGTVARLEQMACRAQARVDDCAIAPMRLAERLSAIGNEDQMNVIGHQAIGPDSDAMLTALLAREIAVEFIVGVGEEHGFAPISALRYMVRQAGNDETGDAGHEGLRVRELRVEDRLE